MEKELTELFNKERQIHFVGVGGVGMSAIARVLHNQGFKVSGSDQKESRNTIKLKEEGVRIFIGHKAENVREAHLIVVSSAINDHNPEIVAARKKDIPIVERARALGYIMDSFPRSFSFAGTHGKTTTSSMAAFLFEEAGLSPTFLVGGEITNLNTNALLGESEFFFAEADESDGSIKYLNANNLIITNLEEDHLDHFGDINDIIELFLGCVTRLQEKPGHLLYINPDQWGNKMLLEKTGDMQLNMITFGFADTNDIYASNISYEAKGSSFNVYWHNELLGRISLSVHGEHNILNALPIIAIGLRNGVDFNTIEVGLKKFEGAKRRFHLIGHHESIDIYDDYAHHPSEIKATLLAVKNSFPDKRIIVAFQPHRFSRTMFFAKQFAEALSLADKVIITAVYSAGENPIKDISGETIAAFNQEYRYLPKKEEIPALVEQELQENDIFITMGAGDIFNIGKELLNRLKQKRTRKAANEGKIIRFA